jgi:exopolysaccharide biosynthesis protein
MEMNSSDRTMRTAKPAPLIIIIFSLSLFQFFSLSAHSQLQWVNMDSAYQPLAKGIHVFKTTGTLDGRPNIAYYVSADLEAKDLVFTADTTFQRRLTPSKFYEKNGNPVVVVNTSFFSFTTNQNFNIIMRDGKLLSYNQHSQPGRGKDTFTYRHPLAGAIGIDKKRKADVAWIFTDTALSHPYAIQKPLPAFRDSVNDIDLQTVNGVSAAIKERFVPWRMKTAVGGGPVLLQNGAIMISNNEELKFGGKAINDKHPRTAMGYTADGKLIILVVQGRFTGLAEGASLIELAGILRDLGCVEALNLDGGGSSCMLVNGKETIRVSDKGGQRPVPGVFLIKDKH